MPMPTVIDKQPIFLAAYGATASITKAAEAAKVTRTMHYKWMAEDPTYPARFDMARKEAAQILEDEAVRRGREGVTKAVIYQGQPCYEKRIDPKTGAEVMVPIIETTYSDGLLLKVLAKLDRAGYGDKSSVEVTGANGGPVDNAITVTFVKPE